MKFTIKVPATTANIGAGFDTSGIALDIYNEFSFDFNKQGTTFTDDQFKFDTSLTLDTFFSVLEKFNVIKPENLHLHTVSNIPIARGMGSSSTCIVAGVLAANHYGDLNLSNLDLCQLASEIEGHPDNVVSAILGNLNHSFIEEKLYNININVHKDLRLIALVPNYEVKTVDARHVLPKSHTMDNIVFNLSRIPFMQKAFETKNIELLKEVTKDKLHQPYRKSLIKNYDYLKSIFKKEDIITHWISGAGPTIMLLVDKKNQQSISKNLKNILGENHDILNCQINSKGAIIK